MEDRKMVHRANQIAAYFEVYPEERAIQEIQTHIRKFWEPRIRAQLINYAGDDLHPLVREAVAGLRSEVQRPA
ncbi:formate dehydrogenase subunit delta [Salinisphaera sp. LB1]|uniref:formate dehydrogenase subunit delta n=1 Tax=Salinisphaera sp. LB1 TaxID=2183911 RepID=UPI000D7074C5|nr:formate dehydrogenase subunit delta [Salinisphaera sp. LB1]AWN15918.1 hypothetical protein SALB1_1720 [Salinisphaera sp. LB1]